MFSCITLQKIVIKESGTNTQKKGEDIKNGIKKCNQGNKTDSFFFIHLKFKNAYDV